MPGMNEARFGLPQPEFSLDLASVSLVGKYDRRTQWFAKNAVDYLTAASQNGVILSHKKRIIDFGAGDGISTIPLVQLARMNQGSVVALERMPHRTDKMSEFGILPPHQIYTGDGIDFLEDMKRRGKKADLIAAFFLDPDPIKQLDRRLIRVAKDVLDTDGHLLITSDATTMMAAERIFVAEAIPYTRLDVDDDPENYEHYGIISSLR